MTKQEFWQTHHGKALSGAYQVAKAEFEAALKGDAPAPLHVYRRAFALVCLEISEAISLIDARSSAYYAAVAKSYGVTR